MKDLSLLLATLLIAGCAKPQVSFTPVPSDDGIEFHTALINANGLLHITVWEKESRKTLWDVNLNYFPGPVLQYGQVPPTFLAFNGVRNFAKQTYPPDGVPSDIPIEKVICVCLEYQYDRFVPSCASQFYAFRLEPDGGITNFGKQPGPSAEHRADIYDSAEQRSPRCPPQGVGSPER